MCCFPTTFWMQFWMLRTCFCLVVKPPLGGASNMNGRIHAWTNPSSWYTDVYGISPSTLLVISHYQALLTTTSFMDSPDSLWFESPGKMRAVCCFQTDWYIDDPTIRLDRDVSGLGTAGYNDHRVVHCERTLVYDMGISQFCWLERPKVR